MLRSAQDLITLSRYQSRPSEQLWKLLKRVLRYIKGTLDYDPEAHSASGFIIKMFKHNVITWTFRRQKTVVLSIIIAEYEALYEVTRDII